MKRAANLFLRFSDFVSLLGVAGAAAFLAAIPVFVVLEVLSRALLGRSIGVSWEYSTYFMALMLLLGAAYTLRTGGHIRVSILPIKRNKTAVAIVECLSSAIGAALSVFLAVALSELAWEAFTRGITSATPAQTPLFLPMAGVAIGAWLLALQMIARIVAVLTGAPVEQNAPDADTATPAKPR